MTKQIIIDIEKCNPCPHLSHTGAYTSDGTKPCCNHTTTVKLKGDNCFKRVITYKNSHEFLKEVKKIPKWCPLPDKIALLNSPKPYPQILKELDVDCDATEVDIY